MASKSSVVWTWALAVAVPLYLYWRVSVANRMPITDCDEVYNYWEPVHYLLFGSGLQTWEYANEYALRTYAYLLPVQWMARTFATLLRSRLISLASTLTSHVVSHERMAIFVLLRSTLAAITAGCELTFLFALSKTIKSSRLILWMGILLLTAPGLNHAAGAYLPSASWMAAAMAATAAVLLKRPAVFITIAVTATLSMGWPFGAAVLVPSGINVLIHAYADGKLFSVLGFIVLLTVAVQGLVMLVDREYYGRWVSPTLEIFTYNAAGGGDELYGVEPASYYAKNLLLNLVLAAPLGILLGAVWAVAMVLIPSRLPCDSKLLTLLYLPILVWLAITVPRPHKEERFLFPIYPLLIVCAVLTVETALTLVLSPVRTKWPRFVSVSMQIVHALIWVPSIALSLSRTTALALYYGHGLFSVYALAGTSMQSQEHESTLIVCTCGEWHRYPGSFYLPENGRLAYLPSSFGGQLPQPWSQYGSLPTSREVLQPFNNQNEYQPERLASLDRCDFVVDLMGSECAPENSQLLGTMPFLNAEETSSTLHRTLYLPWMHEHAVEDGLVHYYEYALYKT